MTLYFIIKRDVAIFNNNFSQLSLSVLWFYDMLFIKQGKG